MAGSDWREMWPESQLLTRVIACSSLQRQPGYWCLESAAVLHGLPLYRFTGNRPHLMLPGANATTHSPIVERRAGTLREGEFGSMHGFPCTSLERTLFDLSRLSDPARAYACANAAMRSRFPRDRSDDMSTGAVAWRSGLLARLQEARGERGVRRARELIHAVDGSAESVLEAVAHQRFRALGYAISTQVRVTAPSGGNYFMDLELNGLGVFCEVDGRIKYLGADAASPSHAQEPVGERLEAILVREKAREDWVRGVTGYRVIRLTARDLSSLDALRSRLIAFRIPVPVR